VTINPETGEKKDIINFYNDIYIKTMKEYIISSKTHMDGSKTPVINIHGCLTPGINKPQIKALCPPSPLRQNLPPSIMNYSMIYSNNPRSTTTPNVMKPLQSPLVAGSYMTPRTMKLYAFGETSSSELERLPQLWGNKNTQSSQGQILNFSNGGNHHHAPPVPVPTQFSKAGSLKQNFVSNI
jgi:hypothetical protein